MSPPCPLEPAERAALDRVKILSNPPLLRGIQLCSSLQRAMRSLVGGESVRVRDLRVTPLQIVTSILN